MSNIYHRRKNQKCRQGRLGFHTILVVLSLVFTGFVSQQQADLAVGQSLETEYLTSLHSANSTITLDLRNVSIAEALEALAREANIGLSYNADFIPDGSVSISVQNESVSRVLYDLLHEYGLEAAMAPNRTTLVIRKAAPDAGDELELFQNTIRGQVTDTGSGSSLPGVNIVVQGTNIGTVTDVDGNFSLSVPSLNETLVISYIGYQTQEIPIGGRTAIDIALQSVVVTGQEMVVTAFGLQREAKSLTYSTQNVNVDQMTEARELNVMSSLQGRVAGLNINQSGSGVGAPTRVILRGNRSISGDSQPLYVIDGVPVRGNPEDLSPDNIASIDVLKGPNAAALYGSAAQNGAIVIETHRGRAGTVNVSTNNTFMSYNAMHNIDFQNEYAQGLAGNYISSSEEDWGPRMEGQTVAHYSRHPDDAGRTYTLTPQPNNVSDGFQAGYNLANNILANVGGDNIQGVFSFTRTDARGIVPGNSLGRNNISLRITSQLMDGLTLDSKVDYMRQAVDNPSYEHENNFNPMRQFYRLPRNVRTEDALEYSYVDGSGIIRQNYWNPGSTNGYNPYFLLNRAASEEIRERAIAMASLTYDVSESLSLMVRSSYDGVSNSREEMLSHDFYARALEGRYTVSEGHANEWNGDFLLSFNENLTADWNLDANFGGSIQQRRNRSLTSHTGPSMVVPDFFTLSNTLQPVTSFNPGSPLDVQSLYAFSQIGWRDAIYLDVSGRNDWSSSLPAGNRSYFYPSAGLSVVLSDLIADFPDLFTFARARFSYAQVGNSAPPFMLNRSASFLSGGNQGWLRLSGTLPNPNLKPENTESFEVGLDVRFLDGRLGLDVTAYKTNTFNQLFTIALPVASGAAQFFTNGGDVENKGIEMLLSSTPLQTMDARWDFNVNFALNRNMVNEISDERPRVTVGRDPTLRDFIIEQGRPFGEIYSIGFLRDDQGRVIVGNDGIPLNTGARSVRIANGNPDWTGSISNTLSWRNISASFLIEHRQGGTMASFTNTILFGDGKTVETLQGREGGLIFGENIFENETAVLSDGTPNTIETDAETFWRAVGGRINPIGEAFVEDMTNTRLREVSIGYSLPPSVLAQLPVSGVKVSLVGRNLLFIYRASNTLDPDIGVGTNVMSEGFSSFAPPTTRAFGANLKIDF